MTKQIDIKTNCDVPALWQEHKNELRSFILKRVKDQDLTNDILQDVLIKVYNFCITKSGVKNIRSWLFQIAQKLNLSLPATKSRIQRARQLLKAEFITCCHFKTDTQGNLISFEIKDSCEPLQRVKKDLQK